MSLVGSDGVVEINRVTPARLTAREAVGLIADGATLALCGSGGGILEAELLIQALRDRFDEEGHPRDLTLVHSMGLGDKIDRGLSVLAVDGLIRRVIGGHLGNSRHLGAMIRENRIEAYNLPLGVLSQLFRDTAAGRPGLLTKTGIGTFVDPRIEGPGLNEVSTDESLVTVMEVDGEEYLFYRSIPIDVAFVRGSFADSTGNVGFDDEPSYLDSLETCMAAARGRDGVSGLALIQVKQINDSRSHPKHVHIPSMLVSALVETPEQWQTYVSERDDVLAGHERIQESSFAPMPFSWRKVVAGRAAAFVRAGDVINLGVGVPDGVASVLQASGRLPDVVMTNEHGVVGGVTSLGMTFGASRNFDSVITMPNMIDLYQGGLLDIAFLGFAQVDGAGNTNVSKYNGEIMGAGGFIDITQYARHVVFCGSLTADGLELELGDGSLRIVTEGRARKFVAAVEHITFSGARAGDDGQLVHVVTERAVFELRNGALVLTEIAPGIELQRDVLDLIDFDVDHDEVIVMDADYFLDGAAR